MYSLPSNSMVSPDSAASALAANAQTSAAHVPAHVPAHAATPHSNRQSSSNTMASALQVAQMRYRNLPSEIKYAIGAHAPTTRDLRTQIIADPSSDQGWGPSLAKTILRDEIDLFSDGPERISACKALVCRITDAQPDPSAYRDDSLAHLINKAIHTFASKDVFELSRWPQQSMTREEALRTARTDLECITETILPLALPKARRWIREVSLCAQLGLEMISFRTPVSATRFWAILQHVESDVSSLTFKSALLSGIVQALHDRMHTDETHTTEDIYLRILNQLSVLPAKHRVEIMKASIHKMRVLPPLERDRILDVLLQQATTLPPEYRQMKTPVRGQGATASNTATVSLRVIEFADTITPEKWLTSVNRLIALVPANTGDRAISLGSLAAKCVRHAKDAGQNGEDDDREERDTTAFLRAFEQILTAIDTTVPPHHRFLTLRALPARAMPTPAYEQRIRLCAARAARATVAGPTQDTVQTLEKLLLAARGGKVAMPPPP